MWASHRPPACSWPGEGGGAGGRATAAPYVCPLRVAATDDGRYELLLRELIKRTEDDHADMADLQVCVCVCVRGVAEVVCV